MLRLDDPNHLWRRYVLALCVVLALLGASHTASLQALSGGGEEAAAIKLSGRQGMLSQRILYFAAEEQARPDGQPEPRLAQAVGLFERSHRALAEGGDFGLTQEGAARRATVYFDAAGGSTLDAISKAFAADARRILGSMGAERDAAWQRMRAIGSRILLPRLEDAAQAFEAAAQERARRIERVAYATFGLAIAVLAAEALLIFWPAQRMVARAVDGLRRSNAALAQANHETTDALEEARAARAEAERAMGVRTQFLANMSHELRTPLNGILGMLELLGDARLDAEAKDRVRTAQVSAEHLLAVVGDVLDLSRIESDGLRLEAVAFDPAEIARGGLAMVEAQAAAKGLTLAFEPCGPVPGLVLGDPTRVRQVIVNLLGNAVKFTEAGSVALSLRHEGDRLRVEVRDTGIGIPPEVQARLFQRFEQGDASITRRHGGTGLGLAISRQLVTLMGGTIGVESAPGAGSAFRFEIPAPVGEEPGERPPREGASDARAERDRGAPSRLRVLVADDNAVNRQVLEAFLRRLDHEVLCVRDGAAAVAAVARGGIDVVLMDVQMPVMDGLAATRAIRAGGPTGAATAILAVTADAMEGDRERHLAAGMDGTLEKPIRRDAFSEAIADALWRARARAVPVKHRPAVA